MRKLIWYIILSVCIFAGAQSCKKKKEYTYKILLSPTEATFTAKTIDTVTVGVTTLFEEWNIRNTYTWIKVTDRSESSFRITAEPHFGRESRMGEIIVYAGEFASAKIKILQTSLYDTGVPTLKVDRSGLMFEASDKRTLELNVISDIPTWKIAYTAPWFTARADISRNKIYVTASPNNGPVTRSDQIVVSVEGVNPVILDIIQRGEGDFLLSHNRVDFPAEGGTFALTVETEIKDWKAVFSEPWLTGEVNGETMTVNAQANSTGSPREGLITLTAFIKDGDGVIVDMIHLEIPVRQE